MRESRGKQHLEVVCDTGLTGEAWRMPDSVPQIGERNLRHNIETCVPSRTTSPLLLLIVNPIRRNAPTTPAHASAAPNVVGRLARKTAGVAPAGICGTRSIREGCVQRACTNGLQPSAPSVATGRRTRIGTRNELLIPRSGTSSESEARLRLHLGSKPRNAATAETTGYARAFRRAADSQHRCRLR